MNELQWSVTIWSLWTMFGVWILHITNYHAKQSTMIKIQQKQLSQKAQEIDVSKDALTAYVTRKEGAIINNSLSEEVKNRIDETAKLTLKQWENELTRRELELEFNHG